MKRSGKTAESIAHIVVRAALDAYRAAVLTTIDAASRDGCCDRDIMDDLVEAEPTVEDVLTLAAPRVEALRSGAGDGGPTPNRRQRRAAAARARRATP